MNLYDGTGVYYFLAQSLDGYIADNSGGLDWLFHPTGGGAIDDADSDPHLYRRFFAEVGAMVMGSGTYESILDEGRHDEWPYGSMPCWVFSSREVRRWPGADIRIVRGDVAPVHEQMRAVAGRRLIWIVGGGNLASQFAAEGLLGALDLTVIPAVLGTGTPVLAETLVQPLTLTYARAQTDGSLRLCYTLASSTGAPRRREASGSP